VVAADVARPGLKAWVGPGVLIMGIEDDEDRPAIRPLEGSSPTRLPPVMDDFKPLGHTCQSTPHAESRFGGLPIEAVSTGGPLDPAVQLRMDGRAIAEAPLGRPATICSLSIIEADAIPGPEIVAAWRIEGSRPIRGFTVYRIPEALDPTPVPAQQ
jgi:hypothetical protein